MNTFQMYYVVEDHEHYI